MLLFRNAGMLHSGTLHSFFALLNCFAYKLHHCISAYLFFYLNVKNFIFFSFPSFRYCCFIFFLIKFFSLFIYIFGSALLLFRNCKHPELHIAHCTFFSFHCCMLHAAYLLCSILLASFLLCIVALCIPPFFCFLLLAVAASGCCSGTTASSLFLCITPFFTRLLSNFFLCCMQHPSLLHFCCIPHFAAAFLLRPFSLLFSFFFLDL